MSAVLVIACILIALSCPVNISGEIVPWIGILKVEIGNIEAVTGLILIAKAKAIASANEISKVDKNILKRSASAIFFEGNMTWSCKTSDYVLHPEFDKEILNTIALVNLDCKKQKWSPINWPRHKFITKTVYSIGFNDERKEFNQVVYKMQPVNMSKCQKFYKYEKIDSKYLWPTNCLCYKGANINQSCIFEAGMALAMANKGNWTLLGISILGPGCNLPSRYINFLNYIPWIENLIQKNNTNYRRNAEKMVEVKYINPSEDIVSDTHFIEDDFYVSKLDDSTMVMRPGNANIREAVHGDCLNNEGVIMYRDAGLVRAPGYTATGVYALSLYDLHYNKITCVMVSVRCRQRSITKFWFEKGFHKDDFADLIKVVPFPKRGKPVPPKVLFLTDSYHKYEDMNIANLLFKFEFRHEATINVDFYGTPATTAAPKIV